MPDDGRRLSSRRSDFVIREARPGDIDALARLEADCFAADKLSRRSFVALARSPSATLLVACRGESLLGYAAMLLRRGGRSARLYSIAVAPEEAGRGIGSYLLAAAEEAAMSRDAERLHLEVRADNSSAIRIYERSGYREIGRRAGYYQDGMTAILFARPLIPAAPALSPPRRLRRAA